MIGSYEIYIKLKKKNHASFYMGILAKLELKGLSFLV
jgi:hypothetical protein